MSDHEWQAPGGSPQASRPDASSAPGGAADPGAYGPPPPPPFTSPGGSPPPPPPPPGAWTPPPKPGLLPLRPLGFGTLLWAPFRTLRRNPAATFGSGLVVQLVSAVATAAVVVPFLAVAVTRLENATEADADAILSGTVGGFLLLMLVPIAISVVVSAFLQGVMVIEVASGTLGDRLGFGALWRRAAKRIWPLIGWTLLLGAALLAAVALLVLIVLLAGSISPTGLAVGIGIAVLLGLGLVVLGAWVGVKLALVPSVIVLERAGIRTAMARSWRLTDGFFWRTFGTLFLVAFILNVAANVVVQPVSLVGTLLAVIVDPTGTGSALTITIVTTVVTLILSLLIGAITAVVQAALIAVIYIDLRMRKEGLDLELERHVEARGAGLPVGDPYGPPAGRAPAGAGAHSSSFSPGSERPATWS
ncbi:glycerophosphoryl diester phosphodiesterase membrane domain-containing protein [Agromyces bauzanensis]